MLSEKNYLALLEYRHEKYTGPKFTEEIKYFKDCDYIRSASHELKEHPGQFCMNPTSWIITPRGEDALAEFEYVRNKDTQNERENSLDRKITILSIAISLITFFAGFVVEHFAQIVDWFISLF